VFDWGDGMARIFIARGMIESVDEKAAETATLEERTEKATVQTQARKRVK
jgi:hypothetical protein